MSVWRVEANVGAGFSMADPPPAYVGVGYGASVYALLAYQSQNPVEPFSNNQPLNGSIWALAIAAYPVQQRDVSASTQYYTRQQVGGVGVIAGNPADFDAFTLNWAVGAGTPAHIDANDGGAAYSGGELSMSLDQTTNVVTCVGPLGTMLAGEGGGPTDDILVPFGIAVQLTAPDHWNFTPGFGYAGSDGQPSPPASNNTGWTGFYGKKDGYRYTGADLTGSDPGTWLPWDEGNHTVSSTLNASQQPTDYIANLNWTGIPPTDGGVFDNWTRRWNGPWIFPTPDVDTVFVPEHQLLLGVYVCSSPAQICLRRSHDRGSNWFADRAVVTGSFFNPVLQWFQGRVWVAYDNNTQLYRTTSRDLGASWSTPVALGITGTNPRLLIHPDGPQFYFYCSGGNLLMVRSMDLGNSLFDGSPITVATTVPVQTCSAVFASDGSILVSYVTGANAWVNRRSRDAGNTWVTV